MIWQNKWKRKTELSKLKLASKVKIYKFKEKQMT